MPVDGTGVRCVPLPLMARFSKVVQHQMSCNTAIENTSENPVVLSGWGFVPPHSEIIRMVGFERPELPLTTRPAHWQRLHCQPPRASIGVLPQAHSAISGLPVSSYSLDAVPSFRRLRPSEINSSDFNAESTAQVRPSIKSPPAISKNMSFSRWRARSFISI